jgi:hypothetical protein
MLWRLLIQLSLCNSWWTVLLLNLAIWNRLGASSFGATPSSHLASQKGVFLPSPIKIRVELKIVTYQLDLQFFKGVSRASLGAPSQTITILILKPCWICPGPFPRPPNFLGNKQVCQFIRQWPPLTLSWYCPFHKKLLLNLSILVILHLAILKTVRK